MSERLASFWILGGQQMGMFPPPQRRTASEQYGLFASGLSAKIVLSLWYCLFFIVFMCVYELW